MFVRRTSFRLSVTLAIEVSVLVMPNAGVIWSRFYRLNTEEILYRFGTNKVQFMGQDVKLKKIGSCLAVAILTIILFYPE